MSDGIQTDKAPDNAGDNESGSDDVILVARTPTSPALLSQLEHSREYSQARGLGAGHSGSTIFHAQRLTAFALIPLAIWFAVSVIDMIVGSRTAANWLAWPVNAALMGLFIVIALRHAVIGIQIVFEDYLRKEKLRYACILTVQAIAFGIGVAVVMALIHLAL